jgi:hypothetical protein
MRLEMPSLARDYQIQMQNPILLAVAGEIVEVQVTHKISHTTITHCHTIGFTKISH